MNTKTSVKILEDEFVSFKITNIQSEIFPRIFFTGEKISSTALLDPYVVLNKPFTYFYKSEDVVK